MSGGDARQEWGRILAEIHTLAASDSPHYSNC